MNVEVNMEKLISEYVAEYQRRNPEAGIGGAPLVKYADASDPMFLELKKLVSANHPLPTELLKDAQTVIAYFIPLSGEVVKSNIGGEICSEEWAKAYLGINEMFAGLNAHINAELKKYGYACTIKLAEANFNEETLKSDWSHRHVAYIAGLGKFGLNNLLITEKGCCGRFYTVVTDLKIEPSIRTDEEYCLFKINGSCKKCVENCFSGALKTDGFDREKCYEICMDTSRRYEYLGGVADACGKCAAGMPCGVAAPKSC